ncbi:TPA_asm: hypothetical protein [ssRNA phage SRR6960549_2]|uniref:Uncharacterized protein n=1 Tax=ssRNA phage SRR6960549_2 TaxID=2786539 RepID=A0A8S5L4F4_9VIRU|nr:hypothetical protein QIJ10_gp1 [ssRNA phage SRR6960549_2]DAD52590.1 TPA_asm: hypothetical protein [ssRNA phage SRR6960549_2]
MILTEKVELITHLNSSEGKHLVWETEQKALEFGLYALDERELLVLSYILICRNLMLSDRLHLVKAFEEDDVEGVTEPLVDGSSPFQ